MNHALGRLAISLTTCFAILAGCGSDEIEESTVSFDVASLPSDSASARAGSTSTAVGDYFTPTSFVMSICTIEISDDGAATTEETSGRLRLFDAVDDEDCIPLDLAAGDRLSDIVDVTAVTTIAKVGWIGIAYLPEITFQFGASQSGSVTGIPGDCGAEGGYWEIGPCRGRMAYDLNLYEPELGWGDTAMDLSGTIDLTMYLDLENAIEDGATPQVVRDFFFFPAMPGMSYSKFRIKKSSHPGTASTDFPHQLFTLFTPNGLPVFGRVLGRNFSGASFAEAARYSFEFVPADQVSQSKENVFVDNGDDSFTVKLFGGQSVSLEKQAHTGTVTGSEEGDYFATYEQGDFTATGVDVSVDSSL